MQKMKHRKYKTWLKNIKRETKGTYPCCACKSEPVGVFSHSSLSVVGWLMKFINLSCTRTVAPVHWMALISLVSSLECMSTEWHLQFPNAAVAYKKKGNVASRLCVKENTEDQEEGNYKG
jgi:hypothetical protein